MLYLNAENISKSFKISSQKVEVLKSVSLSVERGEWVALLGSSGSGKTTLLDILGTISRPDAGTLSIGGADVLALSSRETVAFRRRKIGFVFQAYHMLPELSICENVMLPAMLDGLAKKEAREKACALLERVGLAHRLKHRAGELSGGEQQRAAIARSLMNAPELLLADEPTGNLDSKNSGEIMTLFHQFHRQYHQTLILITHDPHIALQADRILTIEDGKIISDEVIRK